MRTLLAVLALLLLAGCQGNSYERPETTPEKTGEAAAKPAGPRGFGGSFPGLLRGGLRTLVRVALTSSQEQQRQYSQ